MPLRIDYLSYSLNAGTLLEMRVSTLYHWADVRRAPSGSEAAWVRSEKRELAYPC